MDSSGVAARPLSTILAAVYVVQATDTLLFVLLAVSINLLIGYGGMISLGHAAYFAIGGYTAGLLVAHAGTPMLVGLLAGPLVATLAAAFIGLFCIRVTQCVLYHDDASFRTTGIHHDLEMARSHRWGRWTGRYRAAGTASECDSTTITSRL